MNTVRLLRHKWTKTGGLKYHPLNEERNEIRLLHILPDKESTIIRCKLEHVSFHDNPVYLALSYCWGDPNHTRPILVNSKVKHVTLNLYDALQELRRRRRVVTIWIDAICINQEDIVERGHQVLRMRDMYSKAAETFSWLGKDEENQARMAFELIDSMAADFIRFLTILTLIPIQQIDLDMPAWRAFENFYNLPYWERTWIIQELILSRHVTLLWGSSRFPLRRLNQCYRKMLKLPLDLFLSVRKFFYKPLARFSFLSIYHRINQGEQVDIFKVLSRTCGSVATDPRDKIYGILALCQGSNDIVRSPDYTKDLLDILQTLTMNFIVQEKSLDIICLNHIRRESLRDDLPTWVVDWRAYWGRIPESDERIRLNLCSRSMRQLCYYFKACGESGQKVSFSKDGNMLLTDGFVFDFVSSRDGQILDKGPAQGSSENTTRIGASKALSIPIPSDHVYGSKICEALSRTLCMDSTETTRPLPLSLTSIIPQLLANEEELRSQFSFTQRTSHFLKLGRMRLFGRSIKVLMESSSENLSYPPIGTIMSFLDSLRWGDYMQRKLITTEKGYLGLGHTQCRVGDLICLLPGSTVPILLRPFDDKFTVVGEAYIHGIMNGEAWKARDESQMRQFQII